MGSKDSCQAHLFPGRFIQTSFGETNTPQDYTEPDLNKSKFQRPATSGDLRCPPYLRVNLPQNITEQLQQLQRLQGVKRDQIVVLPEGLLIELLNNELDLVTHNCVPRKPLQRGHSRCRGGGDRVLAGLRDRGRERGGLDRSLARAVTAGTVARTRARRHFRR